MKAICITNTIGVWSYSLTPGKIYDVRPSSVIHAYEYVVINDSGCKLHVIKGILKEISELRDEKIDILLDEKEK